MHVTRENIETIGDNCPRCDSPTAPVHADVTGDTVSSLYRCWRGHTWTTNRSVAAYEGFAYATWGGRR